MIDCIKQTVENTTDDQEMVLNVLVGGFAMLIAFACAVCRNWDRIELLLNGAF